MLAGSGLLGATILGVYGQQTPGLPSENEQPQPDKSGYHLFKPTPAAYLREMNTDRPDKTESPYTVDAGHFQVEMDLAAYTRDHTTADGADERTESWALAPVNLKLGLMNDLDAQIILETYNRARVKDERSGAVTKQSGFGDVTLRLKKNFWGNDGGKTAFGVMPFLKLPTNQDGFGNNAVEGGLILPFAVELPAGWDMGTMMEFDFLQDADGSGSHVDFVNTATFGHKLIGALDGYVEFFSAVSTEPESHWVGTVDVGITYALTADLRLDAGVNIGVSRTADDLNPFVGVSYRF